jgi:hypothetical protein
MSPGHTTRSESTADDHVPIEVGLGADGERPTVESNTRIDILVETETYPTARLDDGRYVAWWFSADAPPLADPTAGEWVAAPTRFLAAGTLHELWEHPAAFESLAARS